MCSASPTRNCRPPAPSWYSTFQTAYSNVQIHANDWHGIAANLVSIPNAIAGYAISFNVSMLTINSLVSVLQVDPTNKKAISALMGQFADLISNLKMFTQSAVTVHSSISGFTNNLIQDSKTLSNAVVATKQLDVNREHVTEYLAKIE